MTIKFVEGDVIDIMTNSELPKLLLHVVNCKGVMGSGVALQIKNRIPEAYDVYSATYEAKELKLGTISSAELVVNMAAQENYGRGVRQLNYGALGNCFREVSDRIKASSNYIDNTTIFVPYLMGCDRAGGDWEVVSEMLDFYFESVVVCKYGG